MVVENFSFSFMYKDDVASTVRVIGNNVDVEVLNTNPILNFVTAMPLDRLHLMERLELRCFPRNRVDAQGILKRMGLETYDIIEILKQTHGAMADDFTWIKFEGEDLKFSDVSRRMQDV